MWWTTLQHQNTCRARLSDSFAYFEIEGLHESFRCPFGVRVPWNVSEICDVSTWTISLMLRRAEDYCVVRYDSVSSDCNNYKSGNGKSIDT